MISNKKVPVDLIFSEKYLNRFWSKVKVLPDTSKCWNWESSKVKDGYGSIRIGGKFYRSHRLSYFIYNKIDPLEMHVLHNCDNPSCVNPSHLFLGTDKDNRIDCVKKGRNAKHINMINYDRKGEENGFSKLKKEEVTQIRRMRLDGNSSKYLSKEFNVSRSTINDIIYNKTWKHLLTQNK